MLQSTACAVNYVPHHHHPRHQGIFNEMMSRAELTMIVSRETASSTTHTQRHILAFAFIGSIESCVFCLWKKKILLIVDDLTGGRTTLKTKTKS